MACFLFNDAVDCDGDCNNCMMQEKGKFDGQFHSMELLNNVTKYCCQVCKRFKMTSSYNQVIQEDCRYCERS